MLQNVFFFIILVACCCANEETVSEKNTSLRFDSSSRDLNAEHEVQEDSPMPKHSKLSQTRFSPEGSSLYPPHCRRKAKCVHINNTMCLGAKLPYSSTSLDLVGMTQEQIQEKLQFWTALKHVPRCWAVIQPLLCALYMPRCDNDSVELPTQEMCKMAMGPCRILELERGWTSPLRCDDTNRFPLNCSSESTGVPRDVRFNTTAECLTPLVPTDNPAAFYEGVEGCGLQCANPMFTEHDLNLIHVLIAYGGGICALINIFTLFTFVIDWHSANKYPAVIVLYISFCYLMVCFGFLVQVFPGAREGIVCRKDGTLRMSEPSAGEDMSCIVISVLIYYFLMAACVWSVILAFALHLKFQAFGKIQDRIDRMGAYFHLVAWCVPLVLTVATMAVGEIDANNELGICFVGYMNPAARWVLLLVPVACCYFAVAGFLARGLQTLIRVIIDSNAFGMERGSAKVRNAIVRTVFYTLLTFICLVDTYVMHIYEYRHRRSWRESFRTFIICKIMRSGGVLTDGVGLTGHGDCRVEVRPGLLPVQLHLMALLGAITVTNSWIWTKSTVETWTRFFKRFLNHEDDESVKMRKDKLIAQLFAKRQIYNQAGRLSINFQNSYDDPAGLNFELNSDASHDISTTWAAALPKLVTRRGALILPATGSTSSQYSDFSHGVRRVSLESRRQSLDSQLSAALGEFTTGRKAGCTPVPPLTFPGVSGGRVKPRHRRRRHVRRSRRSSTTSQESQFGAQFIAALGLGNPSIPSLVPNLKRRTGNAGLNDDQVFPSALTAGGLFGGRYQSDATDDDAPEAHGTAMSPFGKSGGEMANAIALNDLKPASDTNIKSSSKSQDKTSGDTQESSSRTSKSNGHHLSRNGRSRDSSLDSRNSMSPSPQRKSGKGSSERNANMNGGKNRSVRKSKDKLPDENVDSTLQLLNSKEFRRETGLETKTHYGKRYSKVPGSLSGSDECSDEENALQMPGKPKKASLSNSNEFSRTPARSCSIKMDPERKDGLSEASSISYRQELSHLQLKSSLPGISTDPVKHVTVTGLRQAREVGTQTSLSSGLNEIGNV